MSDQEAPTTEQQETESQKLSRYFGNHYVGEVDEAAPLAASVEEISEETEEINEEVSEEAEETTSEEETEEIQETEEQESEESESEETEEVPISTVSELLEAQEYDPEWFESLKVSVKVDGKESEVALKDLRNSYQIQQAAESRLNEAKEIDSQAKAQHQELAEKSQALETRFAEVSTLVEGAEKLFSEDFDKVDWNRLRRDDPAEYAAKKRDFDDRKATIDDLKSKASELYQQHAGEQSEVSREQYQQYLQEENQRLLDRIPEWKDTETAKEEKTQLADYLMNQGFSKEDVQAASDHRLIDLARKAMLFDSNAVKTKTAMKKVAKVPKVTKPGATKSAEQTNKQRLDKQLDRVRKTGSLEDYVALQKARRSAK